MMQKIEYAILSLLFIFQISVGQTDFFKNDDKFSSAISRPYSGGFAPRYPQDYSSSAVLNKKRDYYNSRESGASSVQSPCGLSSGTSTLNPPPVEKFVSEFKAAVYSSEILPYVLDFSDLTPEAFGKALYDYILAFGIGFNAENPSGVASAVEGTIKDGLTTYDLPVLLDIYGNTFAKYLFAQGTLNFSNAAALAKKLARTMEDIAERKWIKYIPESKFEVLLDSFVAFIQYIYPFSYDWYEEISLELINEVKRIKESSKC